jgi:hypothetical protein
MVIIMFPNCNISRQKVASNTERLKILINLFAVIIMMYGTATAADNCRIKESTIGIGMGLPYGTVGCNLDIKVAPGLKLSGGYGTTIKAGFGYIVGLKYFLTTPDQAFRPRLSAYYGTNQMVEYKKYHGLSFSVGAQYMWGQNKNRGFDLDIVFMATCDWDLDQLLENGILDDEPYNTTISIGYRYAFN